MADFKTVEELDPSGKRVLLRVDFNVPLYGTDVTDDTRIRACLPTIEYLLEHNARLIILSHLGRPSGKGFEKPFSLAPVAARLSELIDRPVIMAEDVTGPDAQAKSAALKDGEVLLLENLRFDAREKAFGMDFIEELAALGDVYVNDAFGAAHREHASIAGIPMKLPAYAGKLLAREVNTWESMLENPEHPFVAILGGSKVSDKVAVINSLIDKCDTLIIGGGMCFTFLLAQGYEIGKSLKEDRWVGRAYGMLKDAEAKGVKILLPTDIVMADRFSPDAAAITQPVGELSDQMMGLDIGEDTALNVFGPAIAEAKTVFWNGPMGVFEYEAFSKGTWSIVRQLAEKEGTGAKTIIGGGDSVSALNKFERGDKLKFAMKYALDKLDHGDTIEDSMKYALGKLEEDHKFEYKDKMSFISTGGGASMKFIEGARMPGIDALSQGE